MKRALLTSFVALGLAGAAALAPIALTGEADRGQRDADPIRHGRYLAVIGGCNDCHTPDYMAKHGNVPEERWLTGRAIGFSGPWGTTYAPNLRRYMARLTEDEWVAAARALETRPPMPWFNLRAMTEGDLRAIHRYVRSLPPDDSEMPAYVPPGAKPRGPYIDFAPQPSH